MIKDASTAVALVTGLRAGTYRFKLMVQDEQGASDSTILTVTIKQGKQSSTDNYIQKHVHNTGFGQPFKNGLFDFIIFLHSTFLPFHCYFCSLLFITYIQVINWPFHSLLFYSACIKMLLFRTAESLPLTAHASGSHTLTLPNNSLVLRGSVSNCGSANVSFLWVRDEQSPAAGVSKVQIIHTHLALPPFYDAHSVSAGCSVCFRS